MSLPDAKTDATQSSSTDPLAMLKTVFDTKGVLHVESFDEIARKIGIDENISNGQHATPQHVVEARINALGNVARPTRDEPQRKQ